MSCERLQDHWSSGFKDLLQNYLAKAKAYINDLGLTWTHFMALWSPMPFNGENLSFNGKNLQQITIHQVNRRFMFMNKFDSRG